jgi:hypothetical protein
MAGREYEKRDGRGKTEKMLLFRLYGRFISRFLRLAYLHPTAFFPLN